MLSFCILFHHYRCFVEGNLFYATVLAPTCLLIVVNFLIFWPIFKNIIHTEELIKDTIENRKCKNSRRAKFTIIVDISWTIVWVVAVLAYGLQVDVLIYVFHALTPIFGVLVCVVHVVLNKEAKKGWKEMFRCCCCCSQKNGASRDEEMVQLKKHSRRLLEDVGSKHCRWI